jgi:hypothetical protein
MICNKCGIDKSEDLFVKVKGVRVGLSCRKCRRYEC